MKASEFIKIIQKAIETYGDYDIFTENECSGELEIPCRLIAYSELKNESCANIDQGLKADIFANGTGRESSDERSGVVKRESLNGLYFKI